MFSYLATVATGHGVVAGDDRDLAVNSSVVTAAARFSEKTRDPGFSSTRCVHRKKKRKKSPPFCFSINLFRAFSKIIPVRVFSER